ncbi:MAG: SIMPL domain-containing protein [Gammaproteobacteria bacterium]|nr:SIMPL domain-containing protein [Gammaproteobacteria bacterium]
MKSLALVLLLALLPFAALAGALPATPYVQVSGHGSVTVVPDLARVTVSVAKTEKDLALARNDVEQRAAAVIAAARKLGITEHDINAASISIWPEYQWQNNSQVFAGQHVNRNIVITLRDLSRYADLVASLIKAGVTTFDTVLDRSDVAALRRQALAQAVEDAHARALALAQAAQVKLGAVYSITENNGFARPQPMMMAAKMSPADGAQYQPGAMEINADVSVVYLLQPAP